MSKPKSRLVSVVMPCYNGSTFLADSISSILEQTYKNLELIVVNDASTDDSLEILECFNKDKRLKVINLPENGGMSNARNVGNKEAKGSLIAVQDADDISYPNRIERQVEFFEEHPDTGLLYTAYDAIDSDNTVVCHFRADPFNIEDIRKEFTGYIGHPTFMYSRETILKFPYENGQWSRLGCEDFRLYTTLWKNGVKLVNLNETLVYYRLHHKSSTATRNTEVVKALKQDYIRLELGGANG